MLSPVDAQDSRIIRGDDLSTVLNILCAIKHDQVNQSIFWILLFENFDYHFGKTSDVLLSSICQVLCSVNDVQNDRSIVHTVADHSGKRRSVNGCTVGLNRNAKSF